MVVDEVEELDAAAALLAFGDLRATRDRAERDILLLAAHFADLHHPDSTPRGARTLPGTERGIRLAGTGTPLVREFALAEAAAELHLTTFSARRLIGDALETRHRLPAIWARVLAGEAVTRLVRAVAQATRDLTADQAGTVDTALADLVDGRLPYTRFRDILDAAVIAADPDAAAARERAAATDQFAKVGQSNDHGHKTLYVRTDAAAMTRIDTTIAYLADALATLGDPDPEHLRRVKALLIMANPDQALTLIQALATHTTRTSTRGDDAAGGPRYDTDDHPLPTDPTDASDEAGHADGDAHGDSGHGDSEDSPTTADDPAHGHAGTDDEAGAGSGASGADQAEPANPAEPFLKPFRPGEMPPCPCRGGTYTLPTSLLPEIVLYLHLHADTLHAGNGVARWEGLGPVTAAFIRDFLGPWAHFTINGVIDPAGLAPVDAYEIPHRHREALHLRTPADIFPFAPNTSRRQQIDHNKAYRPRNKGGPPGQTGLHNLGKMTTYHHRVKTHAGWQVQQPFPGIYLWQSPHGSIFLVDHTGTRQLRRPQPTGQTRPSPTRGGPATPGRRRKVSHSAPGQCPRESARAAARTPRDRGLTERSVARSVAGGHHRPGLTLTDCRASSGLGELGQPPGWAGRVHTHGSPWTWTIARRERPPVDPARAAGLGASSSLIVRTTRAGLPTATTSAGRSRVTTAPEPTTVLAPMVTPGRTIAPPPSHTLSPMVMGLAASHLSRRRPGSTGWVGVSSWTLGPICTSSPMVIGATSSATSPKFAKQRAPIEMYEP